MTEPERLDAIDYWWSGGFPGMATLAPEEEDRVRDTFRNVLLALPDNDFDTFMEREPTIVCVRDARGATWAMVSPYSAKTSTNRATLKFIYTIYLNPTMLRRPPDKLRQAMLRRPPDKLRRPSPTRSRMSCSATGRGTPCAFPAQTGRSPLMCAQPPGGSGGATRNG